MGLRDRAEMRAMLDAVMSRNDIEIEISESIGDYTYDLFLETYFKVVHPADIFQYDDLFDVWVDKSGDTEFMEDLLRNSMNLRIVGIVQPRQDASTAVLAQGVNYSHELIQYLMQQAAYKPIVREQLANPDINVLSGRTFEDERENPDNQFDFSRIISIDEDIFRDTLDFEDAFSSMDFEDMDLDFSSLDFGNMDFGNINLGSMDFSNIDLGSMDIGNIDLSGIDFSNIDMSAVPPPALDMNDLFGAMAGQVDIPVTDLLSLMMPVMDDFMIWLIANDPTVLIPPLDPAAVEAAFTRYLATNPAVVANLGPQLEALLGSSGVEVQLTNVLQGFIMAAMQNYMQAMMGAIQAQIQGAIEAAVQQMIGQVMESLTAQIGGAIQSSMAGVMSQITRQMQTAMEGIGDQIQEMIEEAFEGMAEEMEGAMQGFDGDALAEAFQIELGEEEIFELMTSIMNPSESNFEQTLHMLGYADPDVPTQILIYPRSFEAKQEILDILDDYNARMEAMGDTEKVIHYTDIVGLMMSTVTDIIDMVSYALVAFVSVALVVSSIMIGVITFISVLERKKEIGILRAVGASKGNIRLVFNAETLIIGFVAGVIGVFATFGIIIIANIILYNELGIEQLVVLPLGVPPILIAISMLLTYIAGLFPASAAASKPPVEALRSE